MGCSGLFGGAMRRLVIRSPAVPVDDKLNWTLGKVTWLEAVEKAWVFKIVSPDPLLPVRMMSSAPLGECFVRDGPRERDPGEFAAKGGGGGAAGAVQQDVADAFA